MGEGNPVQSESKGRRYKYYDLVMAGFVTVILCSNLIGPGKVALVTGVSFGAGNIFFPISYIFDDVLTEVYGYARSRRVIWAAFGAMLFAVLMQQIIIHLPTDPTVEYNKAIDPAIKVVFDNGWRIALGSLVAFWLGDFVNSYTLAKMKLWTNGKYLWTRTIGSTIVGEGVDCVVFYPIAFMGSWDNATLISLIGFSWVFKVAVEVVFTPLTYLVVNVLKKAEHEDYYDRTTDFNPFTLSD